MVENSRQIPNWIDGQEVAAISGQWFEKRNPHNGQVIFEAARSSAADIEQAVQAAQRAQESWGNLPAVQRGMLLHQLVRLMQDNIEELASCSALEAGRSINDSLGEANAAIQLGLFFASETQRLFGRTTTSAVSGRSAMTIRQPVGIAGLIVAANMPIANVAWKIFPALACGNTVVLKAAEDAPSSPWLIGKLAHEAGIPAGVLNIIQGYGQEAGAPLAAHPKVGVVSFTGSTSVGRQIQKVAGERLARVSLELGGKNPLIVCDDADIEEAVSWTIRSVFVNAGQRCAACSRLIIFSEIYDAFKEQLLEKVSALKVGTGSDDDYGPVINERQLQAMLDAVAAARESGATILCGGHRLDDQSHAAGYYMAPTLIEDVAPDAAISMTELFGPIVCLYRADDFESAMRLANNSPYGLTACIHTRDLKRAMHFTNHIESGVAIVNGGTFGSEPHMPFGGVKLSGNGSREPGLEAIDVYTNIKDIYIHA